MYSFICLKGYYSQRKRGLQFASSLPQTAATARVGPDQSQMPGTPIQVSQTLHHFSRCFSRQLDWKGSSQHLNQCLCWNASIPGSSLAYCAIHQSQADFSVWAPSFSQQFVSKYLTPSHEHVAKSRPQTASGTTSRKAQLTATVRPSAKLQQYNP